MPRSKTNKSQAVRDQLASHPQASASEIVDLLKKQGISVTTGLVYALRSKQKGRGKKLPKTTRLAGRNGNMADFFSVLDLARKIGVQNLREIANRLPE